MNNRIKKLFEFLILNIETALIVSFILFLIVISISVIFYYTGETINGFWALIQISSSILAFFILIVDIHDRLIRKNISKIKWEKLRSEILYMIGLCETTISEYIDGIIDNVNEIADSFTNHYYTSFENEGRLSSILKSEILTNLPSALLKNSGISISKIYFLTYMFLSDNNFPYIQEFVNKMNRKNMYDEKSDEYIFLSYLAAHEKYHLDGKSVFSMTKFIDDREIEKIRAKLLGNLKIYNSVEKLEKQKRFHIKLFKIVDRIMKSKIRGHTLSKFSQTPRDLLCVIRYKEKIPDSLKKKSPFNSVFIDKYNFFRPFYRWSIYVKPLDEIPKKYNKNFKLYMNDLIKEVEEIWKKYKKNPKYNHYVDIKRGPTYQYIAFKISGYNFMWEEKNASFPDDFREKILEKLDKTSVINFLIDNKSEVKLIISEMEIDNLLEDEVNDSIKKKLTENEKNVRDEIKNKTGFEILDITDYRKLKKNKKDLLSVIDPYLKGFSIEEKREIIKSIITNSDDYNKIINELFINVYSEI